MKELIQHLQAKYPGAGIKKLAEMVVMEYKNKIDRDNQKHITPAQSRYIQRSLSTLPLSVIAKTISFSEEDIKDHVLALAQKRILIPRSVIKAKKQYQ